MTLASGTRLGPYEILSPLGAGGMGEVYRARDTKVGRTIALMAAPPELLPDERRRASFLHDARAAASLNHPNIATLFDVVEQGGRCYLAYEFAAGPSLRVVSTFGVGYDNVDVAAATARGIPVTNTPDVLVDATADVAFGLLLAAGRRFGEGQVAAREGGGGGGGG